MNSTIILGRNLATLTNATALRNLSLHDVDDGDTVVLAANTTDGDHLGGIYIWSEGATDTDDNLNAIKPISVMDAGRWLLAVGRGVQGIQGVQGDLGPTGRDAFDFAANFVTAGSAYVPAFNAMTIAQGNATIGTGTISYAKSTAASPGTFTTTTLPTTMEAGSWLRVSATNVTGFVATHVRRTA